MAARAYERVRHAPDGPRDRRARLPGAHLHGDVGEDVAHVDEQRRPMRRRGEQRRQRERDRRRRHDDRVVPLADGDDAPRDPGRDRQPVQDPVRGRGGGRVRPHALDDDRAVVLDEVPAAAVRRRDDAVRERRHRRVDADVVARVGERSRHRRKAVGRGERLGRIELRDQRDAHREPPCFRGHYSHECESCGQPRTAASSAAGSCPRSSAWRGASSRAATRSTSSCPTSAPPPGTTTSGRSARASTSCPTRRGRPPGASPPCAATSCTRTSTTGWSP